MRHPFARPAAALLAGTVAFVATGPLAGPALADTGPSRAELTAFAAFASGGELTLADENGSVDFDDGAGYGLVFNAAASGNTEWELLAAAQGTSLEPGPVAALRDLDVDVQYLHAGGTYLFEPSPALPMRPFVALTLGATRLDPSGAGTSSEVYGSASLGLGMKLYPSERVGVRLEARAFATLTSGDSELFCALGGEQNVCAIGIDGDVFTQWWALAGLTWRF
jgi:hypothetical protein